MTRKFRIKREMLSELHIGTPCVNQVLKKDLEKGNGKKFLNYLKVQRQDSK